MFKSSVPKLFKYLLLMKPINIWSWDWSVLDDTGDVDCASSIKIDFSRAKDSSNRNCNTTGVKLAGSL